MVITRGQNGRDYHVGAENPLKNIQLVRALCDLLDELYPEGRPGNAAGQAKPYASLISHVADRPGHDRCYALNTSRLREELGWQPRIDFAVGLRNTVAWYLKHFQATA